ncbi:hypothetical protein [Bradyrhizobium sp. B117]|uniref:hypothetical protein n=1 Tax=Bradyrhizobium sp. B117 TaxID=3140246 RepID=UPI00318390A2
MPDDVTDTVLEARLFASAGAGPGTRRGHRRQAEPDWAACIASSRHRRYAGWTIERIRKDPAAIGPATAALCDLMADALLRQLLVTPAELNR